MHGLSSCGVWAPEHVGSVVAACGLSSCGVRAPGHVGSVVAARGLSFPVADGILVPQPGIKPTSPALEGGFLTTRSPGKSLCCIFSCEPFPFLILIVCIISFSLMSFASNFYFYLCFLKTDSFINLFLMFVSHYVNSAFIFIISLLSSLGLFCCSFLISFFIFLIYLFIYLWPCWVFVSVQELSLVVASGGHSSSRCVRHASHYRGLSCCGAQAPDAQAQ